MGSPANQIDWPCTLQAGCGCTMPDSCVVRQDLDIQDPGDMGSDLGHTRWDTRMWSLIWVVGGSIHHHWPKALVTYWWTKHKLLKRWPALSNKELIIANGLLTTSTSNPVCPVWIVIFSLKLFDIFLFKAPALGIRWVHENLSLYIFYKKLLAFMLKAKKLEKHKPRDSNTIKEPIFKKKKQKTPPLFILS